MGVFVCFIGFCLFAFGFWFLLFFGVFFVEELQNGTFASFLCDVFCLFRRFPEYLEHLWVVKILLLIFPRNNALVLRLTNPIGSVAQAV